MTAAPKKDAAQSTQAAVLSRSEAEATAALFRAVSDATRLQLLSMIQASSDGEARVVDLTAAIGLRQPTVSHHLTTLFEAGVVERRKSGREVWYSIAPRRRAMIADLLT